MSAPQLKPGSQGPEVGRFYDYFAGTPTRKGYAAAYAFLLGKRDLYYGNDETAFTRELQRRLGVPITGRFGDVEAARTGYRWTGTTTPPVVPPHRPIWMYTAPGSGAPGNVGPSFQLGERCRNVLHLNHQWLGYPIGGYLGFMGGDPKFSYNDVIGFLDRELERLLWLNPDVVRAVDARRTDPRAVVNVELWFSAYSQSADGMRRSIARLFGDGGPFALIRDRINGLVLLGDPGTPGTGISGLSYPQWLERLVRDINYPNDFYAIAPDKIRRAMFGIIVEADMELPFFVHVLRLAARIIPDWLTFLPIGSLFGGGAFGPLAQLAIGGMTGLAGNSDFGKLFGMAGGGGDQAVDDQLYNLLKPTGLINVGTAGDLVSLVGALPGLQAHGGYEFDPVMMQRAYDVIAGFRR